MAIRGKQLEDDTVTATQVDTANGTISTVNGGDAAVEGSGSGLSRRDHQHEVATGAAGTIEPDDAAAEGASSDMSRADHKHTIVAAAPAQGIGGSNAEGDATSFARSNHDHTIRTTTGPTDLAVGAIADGEVLTRSGATIVGTVSAAITPRQERVTTENITGADTALADTLDNTPVSNASVKGWLNGVGLIQGAGEDYTISGSTITWLASTGTAPDMDTTDDLDFTYMS